MEKFDEVINIAAMNSEGAVDMATSETQDKRYLTMLRLITFIGTAAYTNTKFKDWTVYNYDYDTRDIKKIIDWLYTCSEFGTFNGFSTNLTSIFIVSLHERLLSLVVLDHVPYTTQPSAGPWTMVGPWYVPSARKCTLEDSIPGATTPVSDSLPLSYWTFTSLSQLHILI